MKSYAELFFLAAAALVSVPARALEVSGEPIELPEAVVVLHYEDRIGSSDAASAGTVTQQLVEDRPILRPGEVLELVPGLVITQHSGAGKANQYFLRGFNLDHGTDFATTLDGVPLNLRTHAHGQGYTDLNPLIPELVDHVDYFKGPYFASKGDFASAGAADLHYAEALPETLFQATLGTLGYRRAVAAGSPELAGGRLLYGFEYAHEDGPWVHPDDYRRVSGVLRYTHPLGAGKVSVEATAYAGTWDATDQIPLRAVVSGALDRYGAVDPTSGGSSHRYGLSASLEEPLLGGVLRANAYAVKYDLDLFSDFTYFLDDPVHGDQFEQRDDRWYYGTSGSWRWLGALAGARLQAELGWEGRLERIAPVGLYHTAARVRLETTREDRVWEASGALYGSLDAAFTPWLRAIVGARYDGYLFDVASSDPRNGGHASAGRASPKASLVLGPWAQTELFANFGYGFHSNDARGVTTTVDPATGERVQPVTPLVQTRGGELGIRTELVPRMQTSLSLWRLDLDSELLFTGDAGTTEPSRPSRRQGLEWSVRYEPLRWLLFDLDLAWSRARFTDPDPAGDHVPGSIETAVSAGATVHALGPWSASAFLRHFGPRPLVEDDRVRSSASTTVNAQLAYRLGEHVRLTLDVFNLLDSRVDDIAYFYVSRSKGEPAAGVADVHFHPAEPRSARATVAVLF
ncbi:TonB-dependent receptor [Anaeromyxobacter paludicola]|uniref:TonB-dependent receptor n=1 Tax=Anaeromyxobacter paludicola TaxID=2918171 RepID=A0ABM7XDQ3_9BACT|nr:TonB-dependent receptor [Anaeromyxobacter paludicola]BDG09973.1 TonB-dependent receptor [Anaeromyxobacter paludicola]